MDKARDTRRRIQAIALELFTERGYEATSLREVAERLGVTKAALYYHFKTKEDIVSSLLGDRLSQVDELLEWARAEPAGPEKRRELIERYCDMLFREGHYAVMRFFERNQANLKDQPAMAGLRDRMFALLEQLSEPGDPPAVRLRRSLAIFAVHTSGVVLRDADLSDDDRQKAALTVALELVGAR